MRRGAAREPGTGRRVSVLRATRRDRIEAAVEAAGQRLAQPYKAWIAADPFTGGVRVLITGPQGFERTVRFALDEAPKRIVIPCRPPAHGCRPEETLGGCPETKGGDASAGERRQEKSDA